MSAMIGIAVSSAFMGVFMTLAVLSFRRSVGILTNPYLWMTKADCERELAKLGEDGVKRLYRQQGTAFTLMAFLLLVIVLATAVPTFPFIYGVYLGIMAIFVFAVVSSAKSYSMTMKYEKKK